MSLKEHSIQALKAEIERREGIKKFSDIKPISEKVPEEIPIIDLGKACDKYIGRLIEGNLTEEYDNIQEYINAIAEEALIMMYGKGFLKWRKDLLGLKLSLLEKEFKKDWGLIK